MLRLDHYKQKWKISTEIFQVLSSIFKGTENRRNWNKRINKQKFIVGLFLRIKQIKRQRVVEFASFWKIHEERCVDFINRFMSCIYYHQQSRKCKHLFEGERERSERKIEMTTILYLSDNSAASLCIIINDHIITVKSNLNKYSRETTSVKK